MSSILPKAVVFDWDNTLVSSWRAIAEAINKTRVEFGLNAWSDEEIRKNCTRAARVSFPEWFGDKWKAAYDFYYHHVGNSRLDQISPTNGAVELLQWLKEKNIPLFIVSNLRGDLLRIEVARMRLENFFVAIAGAQDTPRDKPARDHVDYALKKGSIEAHADIWFVGDSEVDMQCAFNSGCTPVLIGAPDKAKELGVRLVFPDCQALQTLLYNQANQQ